MFDMIIGDFDDDDYSQDVVTLDANWDHVKDTIDSIEDSDIDFSFPDFDFGRNVLIGGGSSLLLILAILVIYCCCRRSRRGPSSKEEGLKNCFYSHKKKTINICCNTPN